MPDEYAESERPALEALQRLGWEIVDQQQTTWSDPRESETSAVLENRLRDAVDRLNPWLNDNNLNKAVREIQQALMDYQRLFHSEHQPRRLQHLRQIAVEAMGFLSRFRPRLVGSVLDGSAGPYSDVNLHVFADTSEEVALFLVDNDIPFETQERRLRFGKDHYAHLTVYRFTADGEVIDLTVFGEAGRREAPRSRVDGAAMVRAKLDEVRALLDAPEGIQ
jgi:hypothetical protein